MLFTEDANLAIIDFLKLLKIKIFRQFLLSRKKICKVNEQELDLQYAYMQTERRYHIEIHTCLQRGGIINSMHICVRRGSMLFSIQVYNLISMHQGL